MIKLLFQSKKKVITSFDDRAQKLRHMTVFPSSSPHLGSQWSWARVTAMMSVARTGPADEENNLMTDFETGGKISEKTKAD